MTQQDSGSSQQERRNYLYPRRRKKFVFSPIRNKDMVLTKVNDQYQLKVFNEHILKIGKLNNGKVNPNSIELVKKLAKQAYNNTPLTGVKDFTKHSALDILTYTFKTLPISKETYLKITNQNNETILAIKFNSTRISLIDLFSQSEPLLSVKNEVQNVIEEIQGIVNIDEDIICEAFSDFEFLIAERKAQNRVFVSSNNLDVDELSVARYEASFQMIAIDFYQTYDIPRRKIKRDQVEKNYVTFEDVYCLDEIVNQFREIGELFKNAKMYRDKGIHIPYGVLLIGEPGAGKTLVTKAFANEYNLMLIEPSVGQLADLGIRGVSWEDVFREARKSKPSVVFIDEIDKITITQDLFSEMDGQISNDGILVIACANNISKLHPALLRPGRFDRKIYFQPLSNETKAKMLIKTLEKHQTPHNLDLEYLVEFMGDVNGSFIKTYVNEAKIKMEINGIEELQNDLLIQSIEFVNQGYSTPIKVSAEELEQTIVHEAGHAAVALALYGHNAVVKIDVRNNNHSMGSVQLSSKLPKDNLTAILNYVKISLGGLIAQKMMHQEAGLGASSDIRKARSLLEATVVKNGLLDLKHSGAMMFPSMAGSGTEKSKDAAIDLTNEIIEQCQDDVETILQNNLPLLNEIIEKLKEKPLLLKDDIVSLNLSTSLMEMKSEQHHIFLNKN